MSCFSSRAEGRSRLLPRTRTWKTRKKSCSVLIKILISILINTLMGVLISLLSSIFVHHIYWSYIDKYVDQCADQYIDQCIDQYIDQCVEVSSHVWRTCVDHVLWPVSEFQSLMTQLKVSQFILSQISAESWHHSESQSLTALTAVMIGLSFWRLFFFIVYSL